MTMQLISSYTSVPDDHPVYIYGTGVAGRAVFARITANNPGAVSGFVDSYACGEIAGHTILDPVEHKDFLKDAAILIVSQSWSDIGRRLTKLGYQNLYNAYPLYSTAATVTVSGLTIIIDNGFSDPSCVDSLCAAIAQTPEAGRLGVIGHNGSAAQLMTALRNSEVSNRIVGCWDTGLPEEGETYFPFSTLHRDYRNGVFDRLILAVGIIDLRTAVRKLRVLQGIRTPLWVPLRHLEAISINGGNKRPGPDLAEIWDELDERHGAPLLMIVPPCAGTMRFLPPIENLLTSLGWASKNYLPLTANSFFFSKFRGSDSKITCDDTSQLSIEYLKNNTEPYYWYSKSLRHYEYMIIHDHSLNIKRLSEVGLKSIILMRDPRDIVNSYLYRIYPWNDPSYDVESFMLDLLDGRFEMATPESGYRWASVKEWTDGYLAAQASPNMEIVRFEDLHRDEVGTLRDILARLELTPNPFVEITDTVLREAARLGGFEYQTSGQAVRGEDRKWIVGQSSCRKGVVGDWRSTFTPAVVEKFKRLTGDALIQLGYEDNMDWGHDIQSQPGKSDEGIMGNEGCEEIAIPSGHLAAQT